jgi:sialate O-acetylesterase
MINKRNFLLAFFGLLVSNLLVAQIKLPAIFSDNMILQRNKPLPVWGTATAGEKVTVQFSGQSITTITTPDGQWQAVLNPMLHSAIPADLLIIAADTIIFRNVLVGDVWLCTGQSNMEYPLDRKLKRYAAPKKGIDPSEEELSRPDKPDAIRYLYVERTLNKYPALPTKGWTSASDTMVKYISAIGYFFAKKVFEETNIPIGIISSSWGGTRIEQWTPPTAYKASPIFKTVANSDTFRIDGMKPGQMYNGMIKPFIPFSIKGILWYQGESNCMIEDQTTYVEKFNVFINSWRKLFNDEQLPIYTVQIAPYLYSNRKDPLKHRPDLLPEFWEAQTQCLKINNTGMVVTTDLVDNLSDIHPSYKWIIAHRLALTALSKSYVKELVYSGPAYSHMKRRRNKIELQFTNTGTGLIANDGKPLDWFTIAGRDGKFVEAEANFSTGDSAGNSRTIIVSAKEVKKPKYVRFAWDEKAQPNLFNKEGLPALPFRTKL